MPSGVYNRDNWKPWNKGKKLPQITGPNHPAWARVSQSCLICKKAYEVKKSHAHLRKTCSGKCHGEYRRIYLSRENAPSWKGGTSPPYAKYGGGFKKWMKEYVKDRDGFRCVVCKSAKGLQVHHVDFDSLHNNIRNLVTLCPVCHSRIERLKIHWRECPS